MLDEKANIRTKLEQSLNLIAKEDNKIDTVFVFGAQHGKIMYSSESAGYSGFGAKIVQSFEGWLGRLKDTRKSLSGINLGNPKYLVVPFEDGLLCLFFEEIRERQVIIGFAYKGKDGEASMGEMLFHTDELIKEIKTYLITLL